MWLPHAHVQGAEAARAVMCLAWLKCWQCPHAAVACTGPPVLRSVPSTLQGCSASSQVLEQGDAQLPVLGMLLTAQESSADSQTCSCCSCCPTRELPRSQACSVLGLVRKDQLLGFQRAHTLGCCLWILDRLQHRFNCTGLDLVLGQTHALKARANACLCGLHL